MKITLLVFFIVGIATATVLLASQSSVPHRFKAGEVASSREMNENFQELHDRIETNSDVIGNINDSFGTSNHSFIDYVVPMTINKKVFTLSANDPSTVDYDTEVQEFTYTEGEEVTDISITRVRQNSEQQGQKLSTDIISIKHTEHESRYVEREVYNNDGSTLVATQLIEPGMLLLTSNMIQGIAWGDASTLIIDNVSVDTSTHIIQTSTLMGVEKMDVLDEEALNCIKVHINRVSERFGNFQRMNWYCSGYGLVKQLEIQDGKSFIKTLSSIN